MRVRCIKCPMTATTLKTKGRVMLDCETLHQHLFALFGKNCITRGPATRSVRAAPVTRGTHLDSELSRSW